MRHWAFAAALKPMLSIVPAIVYAPVSNYLVSHPLDSGRLLSILGSRYKFNEFFFS